MPLVLVEIRVFLATRISLPLTSEIFCLWTSKRRNKVETVQFLNTPVGGCHSYHGYLGRGGRSVVRGGGGWGIGDLAITSLVLVQNSDVPNTFRQQMNGGLDWWTQ